MYFNVGPVEILVILASLVFIIWPACRICSRAGFPAALGLLIVVPLFNLVLLYVLAFAEWPALRHQRKSTNLDF
ncbi:MAG: hypothetical protein ACHRXM_01930 [Isosphaerales bacterium]